MLSLLIRTVATVAFVALLTPASVLAQAWLAPQGEAYFTLGYQLTYAEDHLTATGQKVDVGIMRWNNVIADLNYAVTDRFTVRAGIPFVVTKYTGAFPHVMPDRPTIDDGSWNGTFQDFNLEAKFMATTRGLIVTPFASLGLPSHGYEFMGHSAAGKALKQVTAGVSLGHLVLSKGYTQTRLSYSVPEKVAGISHNRFQADLELGYFPKPHISLRAMVAWQQTFGGWTTNQYPARSSPLFQFHDQLTRENTVSVGAGASFEVTRSMDLGFNAFTNVRGQNTIKASGIAVGATFGFSPARLFRRAKQQEEFPAPSPEVVN